MSWTFYDEFSGCGGGTQGAGSVEGIEPTVAANHLKLNMDSHAANYPGVDHFCEDVRRLDLTKFRRCDFAHFSPICPPFADARGKKQYFDSDTQTVLWEDENVAQLKEETRRGRVLMYEVPRYLEAMDLRGEPVLAGTVENVHQAVKWDHFTAWVRRIETIGYRVWVLALNSAHLHPVKTPRPPQHRNRLLVLFMHKSVDRPPDLDKWLTRPWAWCPRCDQWVRALRIWKKPGAFMGVYGIRHGQYYYRCPHVSCRNAAIEPHTVPALAALDLADLGPRIGDRAKPLEAATIRRISGGIAKHYAAMLAPAGGTWRNSAIPVTVPMATRTTRETDGFAVTPEFEQRMAFVMRNNGSRGDGAEHATPVTDALRTLTTKGHQSVVTWQLMVPYYSNGYAHKTDRPMGTLTTRDRYGLATGQLPADIDDVRFRMLTAAEVGNGMGFKPGYIVLGNKTEKVRQYGQAITPALTELAYRAIVEAVSGQESEPAPWDHSALPPDAPEPSRRRTPDRQDDGALFGIEEAA